MSVAPTPAGRRRAAGGIRTAAVALLAAALALAAVGTRPVRAAPEDHKFLLVRGRVADASGVAVPDVRVQAHGRSDAIALTDSDGRYSLSIDLGTLGQLRARPFGVTIRALRDGWRMRLPGGQPSLAIEVSIRTGTELAELVARSNFGLIAGAVLDALAPPGERTAVIQVRFVAEPGAAPDTAADLAGEERAVAIDEPWLLARPAAPAPPGPAAGTPPSQAAAPAPSPPAPKPAAAPEQPPRAPAPTAPPPKAAPGPGASGAVAPPPASSSPAPAPRGAKSVPPGSASRAPARPLADSLVLARAAQHGREAAAQARRDSAERAAIAVAQARRDSIWRAHHEVALAQKARSDSARIAREAVEDSLRRAQYHLPPRATPMSAPPAKPASRPASRRSPPPEEARSPAASAPQPKRVEGEKPPPAAPVGTPRANPIGLQRVTPGARGDSVPLSEKAAIQGAAAGPCSCRIRGTVELEFHHLLSSPMRVEVTVPELALRDTVELFMGSPREFLFERVPCGHYSLSLRPFSSRSFEIITPEAIAPFDCSARGLRQVRVVLDPR